MLRRISFNLARHAVQTFLKKRPKRPTGTVAREHIKIVYVNIGLSMRTSHFRRIDKIEPIVGYNFAGNIQYETAQ